MRVLALRAAWVLWLECVHVCVCVHVCARVLERECVCAPVHVCMRVCACVRLCMCGVCVRVYVCVYVCARCAPAHFCCCIPVNFSSCITTECQCSANCTTLWGQTKVCDIYMAASPYSCAPLPLAQPGPLLPAGGQGLGGKVQAEWGGASSLLVTLNNRYFLLPLPKKTELLPLEKSIYFTTVSRVICHRPL